MTDNTAKESKDSKDPKGSAPSTADKNKKSSQKEGDKDVVLNKDIRILPNEPVVEFNKDKIRVFRAVGSNKITTDLLAFTCHKSLTPRIIAKTKYLKINNPNLPKLVSTGVVYFPNEDQEHYCFVYENTLGKPFIDRANKNPALGWKPEMVITNIVRPLVSVLLDLRNKDMVHGEIWPGNMFYSGANPGEKIMLGDCLTAPASSQLPSLYEPVERALADPLARGPGLFADDLYALGVSLAVILRTADPMLGKSKEAIIEHKIEKGSYATLIGKDRFSGATLELLRGLLYDDPLARWTIDDVQEWMDGRRLSPKQSSKRVKASRPLVVDKKKYIRPEILAKDMGAHPTEIARLVENGDLQLWLERAIEDTTLKVRMEQSLKDIPALERGGDFNERLCAMLSTAMYPECPTRYKNINFIASGFGKALVGAYVLKQEVQTYVDVLKHSFIIQSIRNKKAVDANIMVGRFDSCRAFITQTAINAGLERCLYTLDNEAPCLSPILEKYYVQTPEDLMNAFEDLCSKSKPHILFDRHVISFLSAKDRKNIDPYMVDISSKEPHKRILGQIRTLATIQKRARLSNFPALATWLAGNLDDLYARFHDANKKEELQTQVTKLKKNGDITKIALLFDDDKLYHNDVGAFYQSMDYYKKLEAEKNKIEEKLNTKKDFGQRTGSQIASVVSMVIAMIIMLMTAYVMFTKG